MPEDKALFPHLPLPFRLTGNAKPEYGRRKHSQTDTNEDNRVSHAQSLEAEADSIVRGFQQRSAARQAPASATLPAGSSILLQVDEQEDIDFLRAAFGFEVVSEDEDGFVIVTTEDTTLKEFLAKVRMFSQAEHGGGQAAKVYRLASDGERLQHILSESLLAKWPSIGDNETFTIDVAIACDGGLKFPIQPKREPAETDEHLDRREERYQQELSNYYDHNDKTQIDREEKLVGFVGAYRGTVQDITHDFVEDSRMASTSFTARVQISGKGLRDIAENFPFVFEIVDPDVFITPDVSDVEGTPEEDFLIVLPPSDNSPAVCVIDSGIQEGHRLLAPAIDASASHCFLPDRPVTEVGDFVRHGGHGTRVAGVVLYKETIPISGQHPLPFWIQNARVLDQNCKIPPTLFPPAYVRSIVERYRSSEKETRLYNHSVTASAPHRTRHMSAWAAEIDLLSYEYDVLFIQAAGNLPEQGIVTQPGISDHIEAGRPYPDYLLEQSCRVPNPSQSLQALTVGSIAYEQYDMLGTKTFARTDGPSSFSKTGLGIWNSIKPDVVEYGGDIAYNTARPTNFFRYPESCPETVRATLLDGGQERDRDQVGTSFAAPKVTHLAARLQFLLPDEPTLLYRALIAQSARWPQWAEDESNKLTVVRHIGYGVPSEERATSNTPYRASLITQGMHYIKAREAHLYQVPIPESMRGADKDFDIRVEVSLSYAARPRRTRRTHKRYLSTWLTWKASGKSEHPDTFKKSIFRDEEGSAPEKEGSFSWVIRERTDWGSVRETSRRLGTLQKDWAIVKAFDMPEMFSLAVVGHEGWDRHPDASAKYALVVSFEIVNQEVPIYAELRASVEQLLEAEVQAPVEIEVI